MGRAIPCAALHYKEGRSRHNVRDCDNNDSIRRHVHAGAVWNMNGLKHSSGSWAKKITPVIFMKLSACGVWQGPLQKGMPLTGRKTSCLPKNHNVLSQTSLPLPAQKLESGGAVKLKSRNPAADAAEIAKTLLFTFAPRRTHYLVKRQIAAHTTDTHETYQEEIL